MIKDGHVLHLTEKTLNIIHHNLHLQNKNNVIVDGNGHGTGRVGQGRVYRVPKTKMGSGQSVSRCGSRVLGIVQDSGSGLGGGIGLGQG